jgi:hypothetical protein
LTQTPPLARDAIRALRASRIREVANAGIGRGDVLPFWFGEPDEVTPDFIRKAGMDALEAGETFYTHNLGIPELRDALAAYVTRLHRATGIDDIAVTNSGMSALMLVTQALIGPGDRVVAVTPLWPNLVEIPKIFGATVECVALEFGRDGWTLDLDRLLAALAPGTRAVYVNSPNNPTGWTLTRDEQRAILAHCRRHRHLDHRGRCVRASLLRWRCRRRCRAFIPPPCATGRAGDQHEHVLEVVADDRMAARLDRRAAFARPRARQAPRVQHVVRAAVRAARRRGRCDRTGRRWSRAPPIACAGRGIFCTAISRGCQASKLSRRPERCTRSFASKA